MSRASADLDRRVADLIRIGRVVSVDPGTATAVVDFGSLVSPALPVGQLGAGVLQFWWMPSPGEQVLVACEGGDLAQGILVCGIYASNAPSTNANEPQINLGGGRMVIDGTLEVTGDVIADGVSLKGHTHSGVTAGPASTGAPE